MATNKENHPNQIKKSRIMNWQLFHKEGKNGEEISLVRIIGFILMVIGIICILNYGFSSSTPDLEEAGGRIALLFFIIMLGFVMMFPSFLTEDGSMMSTMRLISFIIVIVFAMAVIKIGWKADSFDKLKVDATWIGLIGFAFGAKATQKFFEWKMGVKGKSS